MKYICDVCGWEYDETTGDPEHGIAPGTKFADLPDDFECPLCGVGKDQFSAEQTLLKKNRPADKENFSLLSAGFLFCLRRYRLRVSGCFEGE